MLEISYKFMLALITISWILVRGIYASKNKKINWKRELQLMLVYICVIVVARFVFFPFHKVDGMIPPLIFDIEKAYPFRINTEPFVHLFDYVIYGESILNLIGNILMFTPIGIVWPIVFKELNSPVKVIAAGIGFSFCIEIIQLPFYSRVSDIDDLILNSVGYILGYLIYLLMKKIRVLVKKV